MIRLAEAPSIPHALIEAAAGGFSISPAVQTEAGLAAFTKSYEEALSANMFDGFTEFLRHYNSQFGIDYLDKVIIIPSD